MFNTLYVFQIGMCVDASVVPSEIFFQKILKTNLFFSKFLFIIVEYYNS